MGFRMTDPRITAIEPEAIAAGWTHEQLWNVTPLWCDKGLADIIQPTQRITSVTPQAIRLEETGHNGETTVQHFYNNRVQQLWKG